MSIPGKATLDATRDFAAAHAGQYAADAYRFLGRTGLTVSKIGFGTYRCWQNSETHHNALQQALRNGCNIIDTASNYSDGLAESLIGDVLNQEIVWGNLRREQLVIVSKAGYIQGANLQLARERESEGRGFREVVKTGSDLWHCIHPKFLEDQLTRSLARLHLDHLDIYLLHNPEYFLMTGDENIPVPPGKVDEFYERIRKAFVFLEKMVSEGLISYYGISSNSFPLMEQENEFVSLARIWESYRLACKELGIPAEEGHFAVIQMPLNWVESEAFTVRNNTFGGKKYTVLALAAHLNLGVLTNRPINAYLQHRWIHLARAPFDENKDYKTAIKTSLQNLSEYEETIQLLMEEFQAGGPLKDGILLRDVYRNAGNLRCLIPQIRDKQQLQQIFTGHLLPLCLRGNREMQKRVPPEGRKKVNAVIEAYCREFELIYQNLLGFLALKHFEKGRPYFENFDKHCPDLSSNLSVSQKALLVASSVPGVHVVLNGMRSPDYVKDSLGVLNYEKIDVRPLLKVEHS